MRSSEGRGVFTRAPCVVFYFPGFIILRFFASYSGALMLQNPSGFARKPLCALFGVKVTEEFCTSQIRIGYLHCYAGRGISWRLTILLSPLLLKLRVLRVFLPPEPYLIRNRFTLMFRE